MKNERTERARASRALGIRQSCGALTLGAVIAVAGCDQEPTAPQPSIDDIVDVYTHSPAAATTSGIYRMPYADGTVFDVWQDHHTHSPNTDRTDLSAGTGATIVAAAGGWIRYIRDHNGDTFGRGDGLAHDSLTVQDDDLEHACSNNNPQVPADPPNPIVGTCAQYNNYVWIEHPNGEWTKYTHFGTGTVTIDNGWQVDDWVDAGEVLGLEDDIGAASGSPSASHLHLEAAQANNPNAATLPLTSRKTGFVDLSLAVNLVPRTCDEDGNIFLYDVDNDDLTANPCDNDPPTADAGGPYVVDEGAALVLDGTASSDPDGRPLAYRWEPDDNLDDARLAQPTFIAGDDGVENVTLTVYDQMEALSDADNTTITVANVAPTVTIDAAQVTEIDEHGTVTVAAEFTDPGFLDTHSASIDWGVPAGQEGQELAAATIQILDAGGPGTPLRGRVTGVYRYGDNDDGSGYAIAVTVTDDDGESGDDGFALTVHNVAPGAFIDPADAELLNGVPTIVAEAGEEVDFEGTVLDDGSDDLTIAWDWDDGTDESTLSLVNPPGADPTPSPTVEPREEIVQASHTFVDACMYEVTFSATDDDGGADAESIAVLIVGTTDVIRNAGYWTSEYRFRKNPDFSPATLTCYLEIVRHVSAVFDEGRALASYADAVDVLWVNASADPDELLDRQILTAWLNFANGAFGLDQLVDTDGDDVPDDQFADLMEDAEELRLDPARTADAVLAMKNVLEQMNGLP